MATYVNDLRLKEITTGDESGTWGDTTNTNLELIGEAFSYGTEAITTNADTHATTIADGSTDPGRSMYLKYTGTLDSACTITIGPNTISKMWFIENATTGSQNIIISQGSGANITIPAGDTKAVYSDGAGSGAAFFDAFASINVGALTGTSLDISGDIDVDGTTNLDIVDIDGAVDMASTLTVTGEITANGGIALGDNDKATFGVGDDLQIYHNSSNNSSYIDEGGAGDLYVRATNIWFQNTGPTATLAKFTSGGAVELRHNDGIKFATTATGIDVTGTATMDGLTVDLADNAGVLIQSPNDSSTAFLKFGDATSSDSGSISYDHYSDALRFKTINTTRMILASNGDISFYEDTGTSPALFWDASAESLGIGTTSPAQKLDIAGTAPNIRFTDTRHITWSGSEKLGGVEWHTEDDSANGPLTGASIYCENSEASTIPSFNIVFATQAHNNASAPIQRMKITDDGDISFYNAAGSSQALFWDASAESLGIGTTSPADKLDTPNIAIGGSSISGTYRANALFVDNTGGTARFFSTGSNTTTQGQFAFSGVSSNGSVNSERMRIDSSGNVGIGESSPANLLHVKASDVGAAPIDTALMVLEKSGTNYLSFMGANTNTQGVLFGDADDNDVGGITYNHSSNYMAFNTAAAERMRVDSLGRLLLGHTTAVGGHSELLGIDCDAGSGYGIFASGDTSGTVLRVYDSGASAGVVGSITFSTDATSFNTSSDARLKDVTGEARGLEVINELNPVAYNWKKSGKADEGLIAQEVLDLVPNAVHQSTDDEMYSMDYSKLVVHLVKAVQEQQTQIDALQSEINNLKGE